MKPEDVQVTGSPLQPLPPLGRMLDQARFELIPMRQVEENARFLPPGATVHITFSPAKGFETTFTLSRYFAARGFHAVPHLAARSVHDRKELQDIVNRLASGGFDEVFVIGGDATPPAGPYDSAALLLADMMQMADHPRRIGIGAYPGGHPLIKQDVLFKALQDKQAYAGYMITQLCFDPGTIGAWLADVRRRGIKIPVYIGIPGVLNRWKLLGISLKIGVGESTRFLSNHFAWMARLMRRNIYYPDTLVKGTTAIVGDSLNVAGFHLYTFNNCRTTELWRQKVLKQYGVR
jgi:methylenetetrahydrofolate reductase (NADPH)